MSHLEELCAFRAAIALIKDRGMQRLIADTYKACKYSPASLNHVRNIYAPFTVEEINDKIVEMLRPEGMQASRGCTRPVPITPATGTSRAITPHLAASGW